MEPSFDINTHEFAVALSFPGTRRPYVEAVFHALSEGLAPDQVFYYPYYEAFTAVPSLDIVLQDIYRKRSKLNVVFLCEDYQKSEWCGIEDRVMRELILTRQCDTIMPIRMDGGEVDGFLRIDGDIDAGTHTPEEIAALIIQRVTGRLTDAADERKRKQLVTNLPAENENFAGRAEQLGEIANAFQKPACFVVKGAGGFGKTALAVAYAYAHRPEYDVIWLVNAQSALTLEASYQEFIGQAHVPVFDRNDPDAVPRAVKLWLQEHERYLFLFDNAEGIASGIRGYLPDGPLRGHILITTRDRLRLPYARMDLDVLSAEDAAAFFRGYNNGVIKGDARELARQLGRLPLALEHAAAYMEHTEKSCAEYLGLLQENGLELLGEEVTDRDPQKTVAVTWLVSIQKIKAESARQLFNLCAYFAPDDIPLALLEQGRGVLPQPLRDALEKEFSRDKLLMELKDYSLLSFRRDASGRYLLSMHRLMQLVVRSRHAGDTQWLLSCLNAVCDVFDYEYGDMESMDAFERNAPHALAVADHAATVLEGDQATQKKVGWTYHEAGVGLYYSGKYPQALVCGKKALAIREKVLGKEHPDTVATYNNIASVYGNQGYHAKALEWHMKVLAIKEKVLGKEHPDTATTYNNIAFVYNSKGDYTKALEWQKKALVICERVLGKEHPNTVTIYNNIAAVYDSQGDYDKALEWCEKALVIFEKVLVKEHPNTATTYSNIAVVYRNQGDYDKALEWHEKALAIRKKVLGKEHPDTATSYNNIASVYYKRGDNVKALEWHEKALAIREKVPGKEHPDTAATYHNIAFVYHSQGDYDEALEWYGKALVIREKVLGKEHPDTATTYNNIAVICHKQGDNGKALEWHEKALTIHEKVLGKEHPDTAATYHNIAFVYHSKGDYDEALEWYGKALVIREKVLGKEHPDTATIYNDIAVIYHKQGDNGKALEWYEKALVIFEKVLGKEHPNTAVAYKNIAFVYLAQGDIDKALEWLAKANKDLSGSPTASVGDKE